MKSIPRTKPNWVLKKAVIAVPQIFALDLPFSSLLVWITHNSFGLCEVVEIKVNIDVSVHIGDGDVNIATKDFFHLEIFITRLYDI